MAAYRGGRLVGSVAVIDMAQWFGGRSVPCGGVAGVTVAPDQRGRGLARTLLDEAVARMVAEGACVSSLYPTTASLYRSLGWEVAGGWARTAISTADLPRPTGGVDWEPVAHTEPALATAYEGCAHGRDGWILPPARWWRAQGLRRELDRTPSWSWLGRRDGAPVAAVAYHHARSERAMYDIEVDLVAGVDGPALTDALAFLGASGTTVDRVKTSLPPAVLRLHLAEPSRTRVVEDWPWMLRLVDLPAAMAARGWPAGLTTTVALEVEPPTHAPDGIGAQRWVLEVADGRGPPGAGRARHGAPLGLRPGPALRRCGRPRRPGRRRAAHRGRRPPGVGPPGRLRRRPLLALLLLGDAGPRPPGRPRSRDGRR